MLDELLRQLLQILSSLLLLYVQTTAMEVPATVPPIYAPTNSISPSDSPLPSRVRETYWITSEVSWYGPGFYGNRTACGYRYNRTILGVAHRTLPCGTLIEFLYKGQTAVVPVIDRGPYIKGRDWDLSRGLCTVLSHCFTGKLQWRLVK